MVEPRAHASRALWDAALAETVASFSPDLVVLAGFMRIVGASMLARFPQRIVNVHPALLPSFPGAHGARDAIAKGVRISGCTVHLVDAGVVCGVPCRRERCWRGERVSSRLVAFATWVPSRGNCRPSFVCRVRRGEGGYVHWSRQGRTGCPEIPDG